MKKFGVAASQLIEQFDPADLLKFLRAYEQAGCEEELWAKVVASQRVLSYSFPCISLDVALCTHVPSPVIKRKGDNVTVRSIGGRYRSGMAVWEASFVLAEFLSQHGSLAQVPEVKELMAECSTWWGGWKGKSGVELGAGLGLPSIVASNLGAKMIATDGDDAVLHLLCINAKHNAPSCVVQKLF